MDSVPTFQETLSKPDSRWKHHGQIIPSEGRTKPTSRYNLLVYLRNLNKNSDVTARFVKALEKIHKIGIDYQQSENGIKGVVLKGNDHARSLIHEMDALIRLAKTVYTPPEVQDWIHDLFLGRYRPILLEDDKTKRKTLTRALDWGDKWAQVRYRFLSHYLRDDPTHWQTYSSGFSKTAGDLANMIVHTSAVEIDCELAETLYFTDQHRAAYRDVYGLTAEEGRRLCK